MQFPTSFLGLAILFVGIAIGFVWCWVRDYSRNQDLLEGMRMQEQMHQAEKEAWLKCAMPPIPSHRSHTSGEDVG